MNRTPDLPGSSGEADARAEELPTPPPSGVRPLPAPAVVHQFSDVYEAHFAFVWRTARHLGVQESALDDVCQETFVVVHRRLHEFDGRSSLGTWIFGIVNNVVRAHRRTLQRKSVAYRSGFEPVDPDTLSMGGPSPEGLTGNNQAVEIVRKILSGLDEDKRTVLSLVEIEGLTIPEIAVVLDVNVNTLYARLRVARQEFSQAVQRFRAQEDWKSR